MTWKRVYLIVLAAANVLAAERYSYVVRTTESSALIAWGSTAGGQNTIGMASVPIGKAIVRLNGQREVSGKNWVEVDGLSPDTEYPYEIDIDGKRFSGGVVRTLPAQPTKLNFLLLGDFGDASSQQYAVAKLMWTEYQRQEAAGRPVRFVLTVGDNIYATRVLGFLPRHSGADDADWESRFFVPYASLLARVPFYPSLGNHDGNESEVAEDLTTYLDNFFLSGTPPRRYYSWKVGTLAEFFAIDTTKNYTADSPVPGMDKDSAQYKWLRDGLAASKAKWKIVYGHHPPYTAGPRHVSSLTEMQAFLELFKQYKVAAYFCGHEHNFQMSVADTAMAPARMILSGAGGELRALNVRRQMKEALIAAWAPVNNFLSIEIDGDEMRVAPFGPKGVRPVDPDGNEIQLPIVIKAPQ